MERKIGEVFEFNGVRLQAVEAKDLTCNSCYFSNYKCCYIKCMPLERKDKKNVMFKKFDCNITIDEILSRVELRKKLCVLKEVANEYSGKTIDNIIVQIESRIKAYEQ